MHVHIGIVSFTIFLAYWIITKFLVLLAATQWADRPIGQALAALQ